MNATNTSSVNWIGIGACVKWSKNCKPMLRSLGDLKEDLLQKLREEENNDMLLWGVPAYYGDNFIEDYHTELNYYVLEFLYKNHFDVFGLIDKGLAIDINTIK